MLQRSKYKNEIVVLDLAERDLDLRGRRGAVRRPLLIQTPAVARNYQNLARHFKACVQVNQARRNNDMLKTGSTMEVRQASTARHLDSLPTCPDTAPETEAACVASKLIGWPAISDNRIQDSP